MKKITKQLMFLTAILFGVASALAQSGDTGPLHWKLSDGTLTISGEGAMPDYGVAPWVDYREFINIVEIKVGVTSIGNNAFCYCQSLTSITIPNGVTTIGTSAFSSCLALIHVNISSSVSIIEKWAFNGCTALTSINVDSGNVNYFSENGVLFNKGKTTLVCCPGGKTGNYDIPNSVTAIGENAFYCCSALSSITIPSSVSTIEHYAFIYCDALTSVTNLNLKPINIMNFYLFYGIDISSCTLTVPTSAVLAYKNAEVWRDFIL